MKKNKVHKISTQLNSKILGIFILGIIIFSSKASSAQLIYGLSNGNLISFDASNPSIILSSNTISGITSGQSIEGIDFRPNTGELYALGYDRNLQTAQVYTIQLTTAIATGVTLSPISLPLGPIGTTTLQVGFDFNPTVDRIRVVSNFDYNYRLNPATGAISFTDLNLNYAIADMNAGADSKVISVAYTNSYIGSTSTTLYDIDLSTKVLAKQDPPNNGTLNTIATLGLPINKSDLRCDLDIFFDIPTQTNIAYLVSSPKSGAPRDMFGTLNTTTGAFTLIGKLPISIPVSNIACYINRTIPALTGNIIYALNTNNFLLSFDSNDPTFIRTAKAITGITLGQTLVGIDFRPATGQLYGLGYNSLINESQLYTIDHATGFATIINVTPTILMLGGNNVGMDFNPTVDKIRIVSANNMNYRLNLDGTIFFTDLNLNYAGVDINFGADPQIGAVAYTNSFAGSLITALYDYDQVLNCIAQQTPPNDGVLVTKGSSGISQNLSDPTTDMDIYYDGSNNIAYLSSNTGTSSFDHLYTIDVLTGASTLVNKIGNGIAVRNIAVPIMEDMKLFGSGLNVNSKLKINVYPSPADHLLTVNINSIIATEAQIKIFDLSGNDTGIGETILVNENTSIVLNVNSLLPGTYFLNVKTDTKAVSRIFIKL